MTATLTGLVFAFVAEAEPSKTPFYFAGAALVTWIIGLSLLGMRRPSFPTTKRDRNFIVLATLAFVVATMAGAIVST